ncbi:MAG: hypothetical protein CVV24_10825 [Ignavibacteriae bacterium HGW-Ignavibacteriae-3]|nr:MAG: hypothetical protein CVV24_10825 [Ignavibacteriae bacterium HGW-Ignavibacteriae-3]
MSVKFKISGKELLAKIEELIKEGNASRIIVRDESGKVFIEIPVTVGVIGAVLAPVAAALGAVAGLAANYSIEVIHKTGTGQDPAG